MTRKKQYHIENINIFIREQHYLWVVQIWYFSFYDYIQQQKKNE